MGVKALVSFCGLAALLALTGCGGGTKNPGDVSGVVFDENGDVVRNARVYFDIPGTRSGDRETVSNSSGAYVLSSVGEGDRIIRAFLQIGSTRYYGINVARINRGERTKNVNIVVYPEQFHAMIRGNVKDRNGFNIVGARVFARQAGGTVLSSSYAITDVNGDYEIQALSSGLTYDLLANARGYNGDVDSVVLTSGESRRIDFILGNPTDPALPRPTNVSGVAWTSPFEATRSLSGPTPVDILRSIIDPNRKVTKSITRSTVSGDPIQVDLFWDRVSNTNLLGYGVYRSTNGGTSFINADFVRDPLAEYYADSDDRLRENTAYTYAVTSLNTLYPDTGSSESAYSNLADVRTLGSISSVTVTPGPLRFSWNSASGAEAYAVFLFDQYPAVGVTSIWNNFSAPVTGTTFTYNGPTLATGRTYWGIVLGFTNDQSGRTVSRIFSFTN